MKDKIKDLGLKKIIVIILVLLFIIGVLSGFIIALNNHKSANLKSSSTSASDISSNYNVQFDSSTDLEGESITSGGSYTISGDYGGITINTKDAVELRLDGASIMNNNGPAIYVESAKSVSIVLIGENKIISTTTTDLDGAIYSKDDLILSGDGSLDIESNYDGIVSKDTLVINSGTYTIKADDDGIRGKDNVAIVSGTFTIDVCGDGIKATNEEESGKGYVAIDGGSFTINSIGDGISATTNLVINDGTFNIKTTGNTNSNSSKGLKAGTLVEINSGTFTLNNTDDSIHSDGNILITGGSFTIDTDDDAIHTDGMLEINDGVFTISGHEGLEGTYIKVNGGKINIQATDDGMNAGNKSNKYTATIEINGGSITIDMGQGDTDAIDSNGNIYINGGTLTITAQSAFDYDGEAKYSGGKIIVNGEETTNISNQMMGGRPGGMRR